MLVKKWPLILIILLGGIAVLGSYVLGVQVYPGKSELLWGGMPENLRPWITANMFLAAAGYLVYTYFILFRLDVAKTRVYHRYGFRTFYLLYAAILIPSALWMPLTLLAVQGISIAWVWLVRLDLVVVGLASLALLFALWKIEPRQPKQLHRLSVIGAIFFCVQTVLLDAVVWSVYFGI